MPNGPAPEVLARLAKVEQRFALTPGHMLSQDRIDGRWLCEELRTALTALAATQEERDRWKAAANWAKYHGRYLGWAVGEVHAYDDSHGGPYNAARVATVPHTDNREGDDLEAMVRASQVPPGSEKVQKVADMLADAYNRLAAATREAERLREALTRIRNHPSYANDDTGEPDGCCRWLVSDGPDETCAERLAGGAKSDSRGWLPCPFCLAAAALAPRSPEGPPARPDKEGT